MDECRDLGGCWWESLGCNKREPAPRGLIWVGLCTNFWKVVEKTTQWICKRHLFQPRALSEALSHDHALSSPVTRIHTLVSSLPFFPSNPSAMSVSPIPRPPSRSERLLRDTLRKDDTLRTHGAHSSRPRSASSNCDEDEDDNFFQSAILFRCSSRRNSAASALGHGQPAGYYVPDQDEHASYSRLLRSSSHSGSSRSSRSDRKSSPRPAYTQEKQEELSRHHDAAPHEAVLRSRFDSVIHSMRIDRDRDGVDVSPRFTESGSHLLFTIGTDTCPVFHCLPPFLAWFYFQCTDTFA